ncbi:MAG: hypothetical protein K6E32_03340 [Lachnospiraceae bacterium]|nr:hypothetical protein [Lachnospiraceae bacterium]
MKRFRLTALTITLSLLLSACGSIPNLTQEENRMVSEYAASLMLKYDSANHTRLVDTSEFLNSYYTAKRAHDDAEKAYYDAIAREEEQRRREAEAQKNANSEYNSNQSSSNSSKNDGTGGAKVVDSTYSNMPIGEFLGYGNFDIAYAGFELLSNYPKDNDAAVSLSASSSNTALLVVYFDVTNNSQSAANLDILSLNCKFRLSINDGSYKGVLYPVMLDDILSECMDDFAGLEKKRLVLIMEVDKNTVVDSLSMTVTGSMGTLTKKLK